MYLENKGKKLETYKECGVFHERDSYISSWRSESDSHSAIVRRTTACRALTTDEATYVSRS